MYRVKSIILFLTLNTSMDRALRLDLIFSYWIFAWYVLYMFNIVNYNPKLALIFGVIFNFWFLIKLIYLKRPLLFITLFIIIVTFTKILPLYTVRNTKIDLYNDAFNLFVLFAIYNIYLYMNGTNFVKKYFSNSPPSPLTLYILKLAES